MLVNPSIYNSLGKFTSNFDLLTLERRNGVSSGTSATTGYPYKNSLSERINQSMLQKIYSFDTGFQSDVKSVFATVKLLSNNKSAVYDTRKAVEASKAFDVSVNDGASIGKQSLKVSQIAVAQKNTSASRAQKEVFAADTTQTLTIKQGTKTQSMEFTFKAGETTEEGYLRFSKTFNQAKTGVTAQVKTDDKGYSTLSFTADKTGKDTAFELSGTMADELKLNDNKVEAANMTYELNGKTAESQTNTLSLDKGKINIEVKATNTEAETFDVQASSRGLVSTLKDFASAFNQFVDNNKDNANPMTKSIIKQMTNTVIKSIDRMDIEGLSTDSSGKVVIDEAQLTKSLEGKVDTVKNELNRFDSFASNITRKADQILNKPMNDFSPAFNTSKTLINPFMYNYDASYKLNNINQLMNSGSILDIKI